MTAYVPPEWGVDGANTFKISLDVIKSGVVVEQLDLPLDATKSCVVVGRMEPLCDLVLHHPSISRVHAALQFDSHGALFVQDLTSSHGTFINKRRVAARAFERLHIGDVVVFGESTRLYAVCGPPELLPAEYDSTNLQRLREKSTQRQTHKREQRRTSATNVLDATAKSTDNDDDNGASWGFRDDAIEDEDRDEDDEDDDDAAAAPNANLPAYLRNLDDDAFTSAAKSSVNASDVHAKDAKLFTQLQNRLRKLENLEAERSRIVAKQHRLTGLSDGQQHQLSRIAAQIGVLQPQVRALEQQIHAKNAQRHETKAQQLASKSDGRSTRTSASKYVDDDDDDDDFYDRTASNKRKLQQPATITHYPAQHRPPPLTAASIQQQIAALERLQRDNAFELEQARVAAARDDAGSNVESGGPLDALDAFMATTTHALHATQLATLEQRRDALAIELKQQQQLLVVATPALARVGTAVDSARSTQLTQPQQVSGIEAAPSEADEERSPTTPAATLKQPSASSGAALEATEERTNAAVETTTCSKDSRDHNAALEEAALPRTTASSSSATNDDATLQAPVPPTNALPLPKKPRIVGPTRSTQQQQPATGKSSSKTKKSQRSSTTLGNDPNALEGGERVWVPPTNQTGDGRTALNDKFGY